MHTTASRSRRLAFLAAVHLVLIACGSGELADPSIHEAPDEPATLLGPGISIVPVFNYPHNGEDNRVRNRIISLIDQTPAGQSIRAAIYNIEDVVTAQALLRARRRGVAVYVVNSGEDTGGDAQMLKDSLGVRYHRCSGPGTAKACISNRDGSSMHSKFYLFSRTVDAGTTKTNVLAVTSANPTLDQPLLYNNLVVVAGDPEAYTGFLNVFNDMMNPDFSSDDYRRAPNGYFKALNSNLTAYFSPMADDTGGISEQAATDQVALTMQNLDGGTGCFAYAVQSNFTEHRDPIATQLIRIRNTLRCDVRLAYTRMDTSVERRLRDAAVSIRRVQNPDIHSKYYILYGTYADNEGVYRLFTGSHNWTGPALRKNDEVLLKLWEKPVVDSFRVNFNAIWARGVAP